MSKTWSAFLATAVSFHSALSAATYYVATNGSDSNDGLSTNTPFATPQKAVTLSALTAGDTIYVRGGTYVLNARVNPSSSKNGTPGNHIKLWAYPGELPEFDFDTMPESSDKALDMRRNYWHVRGIEVRNAPDSGILVGGTGNIIEGCVVHDCDNDGLVLGSSSVRATNALILNCDSYRNYQAGSGGNNGDGFAAKIGCGPGNVFRGCRAWNNSDDAWDFYDNNTNSVVLEACWAFRSGYDLWGIGGGFNGNGNGFKLGGEGTLAGHFLTNCVAFGNKSKGFDHNNGNAGQTIVNCTGYSNNVNFSFYEIPATGTNLLINNLAYAGISADFNLDPTSAQVTNSWQGFVVTVADFASLDTSMALLPRNADYSLQTSNLFHLAAGSDLIDRGMDVGLPFNGSAPDLGAFEFEPVAPPQTPPWFDLQGTYWTNGGLRMLISGLTSHGDVIIHSSADLLSWSPVYTNAPVTGSLSFLDSSAASEPQRFYRAEEK
jgi:hypothetical protein